jgi:hypothetical protein
VTIEGRIKNLIQDIVCNWVKKGTVSWSSTVSLYVTATGQLAFKASNAFPSPDITESKDDLSKAIEFADNLNKIFRSLDGQYFTTIDEAMTQLGNSINDSLTGLENSVSQQITSSLQNNFISPTGQVFFFNNPRLNEELDLQMDLTYRV